MRWNRQVQEELALLPMQQQRPPNPDRPGQVLHLHEHRIQKMKIRSPGSNDLVRVDPGP
jgi:hypothetical protein